MQSALKLDPVGGKYKKKKKNHGKGSSEYNLIGKNDALPKHTAKFWSWFSWSSVTKIKSDYQ